ncbi:MAG TPA: TIR domain-containing protein [Thermoanaerobaculia bacterium]|nr:TIR domain-containing protein [Thermoanaerobaculia bacterium]
MSPTTPAPPTGDRSTVFISYSHLDEPWKDRVVKHLKVLEPGGVLEVWDDRRISGGDDWLAKIQEAMDRASVAVLLISADFLGSTFILETEVPYLLQRQKTGGIRIIPIIVRPCSWARVAWLSPIQCRPKDGQPLSGGTEYQVEEALTALALEIQDHLGTAPKLPRLGPVLRLDLGRLPTSGSEFVGREAELDHLDAAWDDPKTHVVTLVAFGGVGKSTLVSRWLDRRSATGWPGVRHALDWSFYSQGTEERVSSADGFLDHALRFFGEPDPTGGAPRDRGLRLAELVRRERTLLILDGVEPLQYPPGPLTGRLKDPGLAALLKSLAAANSGLCLVTTREHIADLNNFTQTAPQWDLEHLTPGAGATLLRCLGVQGKGSELRVASEEMGGHALALTLLGNYIRRAFGGDVRRRKEVDLGAADERQGGRAFQVIRTYVRWLGEGPEVAILRLLGLFDRPAEPAALAALRATPLIPRLTDGLWKKKRWRLKREPLSNEDWNIAVSNLREHGLLLPADPHRAAVLDAHPLVRAYFQEQLEKERSDAWREGNLRLYEYLKEPVPDLPETLAAMEPLFAAVVHGCRAGRQPEVFREVYRRRIQRGENYYCAQKLGAFGSELTVLSGFFDHLWDQPSAKLTPAGRAFVLNNVGFDLRALGRLVEAVQPMQAGFEASFIQGNWKDAAEVASNLSELTLALGEISRAMAFGEQSVELADRTGDVSLRMLSRTTRAEALHQSGRWEESAKAFREAEAMQAEVQPEHPRLYSLRGYQYCDLLLSRAEPEDGAGLAGLAATWQFREACRVVRARAMQTLHWVTKIFTDMGLLDFALNHLTLGRAYLGLALTTPNPAAPGEEAEAQFARSAEHLDSAIEGLRQASYDEFLSRGLQDRAAFRRWRGDLSGAKADLDEALEIAERGSMRLHECDAHLEWTRLCLQQGDAEAAWKHVATARKLVAETGYGRREREVGWLERRLAGEGGRDAPSPSTTPSAGL